MRYTKCTLSDCSETYYNTAYKYVSSSVFIYCKFRRLSYRYLVFAPNHGINSENIFGVP